MLGRLKFELDELVNEMLDQIPQDVLINGTVLDPAFGGGQFLREVERRKRAAGKTDAEIKATVFGIEDNLLRVAYAVNKYKLAGTYSAGDFLGTNMSMKFDVIVGNPPYQSTEDGSKRKKMWVQFAEMAIEKASIVAMVTPTAWQKENSKYFTTISNSIRRNLIAYGDANNHFSVGEDIGFWIVDKNASSSQIIEVVDNNKCSPIYKKMLRKGGKWHYRDFQQPSSDIDKKIFPDHPTREFNVPIYWTAKQVRYARQKDVKYFGWKVIVNNSGHYYSADGPNKYSLVDNSMAVGLGAWGIKVPSKAAGERMLSWVQSKLYRVVVTEMKTGGFNNPFVELENLGHSKIWTDAELYQHFGLTQDEIDYIEQNVK